MSDINLRMGFVLLGSILSIHPTYAGILNDGKHHLIRPKSIQKELDNQ